MTGEKFAGLTLDGAPELYRSVVRRGGSLSETPASSSSPPPTPPSKRASVRPKSLLEERETSLGVSLWMILWLALFLRVGMSFWPYSGEGQPPFFGDFEAQRHWKEITRNFRPGDWYGTEPNYWPLDYPPLTAYHEWLMGKVGEFFMEISTYERNWAESWWNNSNQSPSVGWFELHASRGLETQGLRRFMRLSVLLTDLLIFWTSALWFLTGFFAEGNSKDVHIKTRLLEQYPTGPSVVRNVYRKFKRYILYQFESTLNTFVESAQSMRFLVPKITNFQISLFLLCPTLITTDHGHFQYNCAALGLVLASVGCVLRNQYVGGSIFFVMAIMFKQTNLYFAPAFFFYFIGVAKSKGLNFSVIPSPGGKFIAKLAKTVILTFCIILLPLVWDVLLFPGSLAERLSRVYRAVFPFHRGVFEDYVSNFWITFSPVFRLRSGGMGNLVYISGLLTIASFSESAYDLMTNGNPKKFLVSLIVTSLGFFLCSWQVHEKGILLSLLSLSGFAASGVFESSQFFTDYYLPFSVNVFFSMLGLFRKDRHVFGAIIVHIICWGFLAGIKGTRVKSVASTSVRFSGKLSGGKGALLIGFIGSIFGFIIPAAFDPPVRYPFLWDYLLNAFCFSVFAIFHRVFIRLQLSL